MSTTDFERGVRAGVEAFDLYFRTEDEVLFAGQASYRDEGNPDAGYDWRHYTDAEFEDFRKGAVNDALGDERRRLARRIEDTPSDEDDLVAVPKSAMRALLAHTVTAEVHAERARQIAKGYDAAHDDEHGEGHLLEFVAALIDNPVRASTRAELVKAAALLVAVIEVLDRRENPHD